MITRLAIQGYRRSATVVDLERPRWVWPAR